MSIKLWAGVECTVNRVGTTYFDQLERSGHDRRLEDLDLFAQLGITTLRYPILWERTVAHGNADWRSPEERLQRLRKLGIQPIVGLLHHGSGPSYTSLVDPNFPELFSEYARSVAERFPLIEDYTPINEPLTTARFSTLYGLWYPHFRSDGAFARALLLQCRATTLAMRKIRRVNPEARLVQTEDLGKIFSTAALAYQARFENERRWLTYDILCGRLKRDHRLWNYFRRVGISECELLWFRDNPCPPDVIGINHYVTSDRYLDENLSRYPSHTHGGNRRHQYADVEAVRVELAERLAPEARIAEAWERYRLPLAVTEVHLGCTGDEQLRWFRDVWKAAENQKRAGANVIAVTAWALLGAFDWDCLLTRQNGHYEPGVFDIRHLKPQPTALAEMLQKIAHGEAMVHEALQTEGWWCRPERILYPSEIREPELACHLKGLSDYRAALGSYNHATSPLPIQNP